MVPSRGPLDGKILVIDKYGKTNKMPLMKFVEKSVLWTQELLPFEGYPGRQSLGITKTYSTTA